jgi:hypothetical protein
VSELDAMNLPNTGAVDGVQGLGNVKLELPKADAADGASFRAALDRHLADPELAADAPVRVGDHPSLGKQVASRVGDLASEFQKDQQYVSKLLEKATRTGDSMHLMRAMMALNDYQIRVQAMSKTVSKAVGALDQLTKMQ